MYATSDKRRWCSSGTYAHTRKFSVQIAVHSRATIALDTHRASRVLQLMSSISQGLSHRPEKDTLIQRNILPDSNAAPGIQGQQKELEKHMRADSLEKHLAARPNKEELLKEGILKGESLEIRGTPGNGQILMIHNRREARL